MFLRHAVGIVLGCALTHVSFGSCLSLIKGPVIFDIQSCRAVDPKEFNTTQPRHQFIKDLDAAGRKEFEDSYRGALVKGKVMKSEAVQEGISKVKGILAGQVISVFIPPGQGQCPNLQNQRLSAQLSEVCCNGTGDRPCLLDTSYIFSQNAVLGQAGRGVGDAQNKKVISSPDYQAARKLYSQKKYKEAIPAFEKAMAKEEMDIIGYFQLANSYYHLDQCRKSLKPLKKVYDMQSQGSVWADDEMNGRRAIFLLARCYAKLNDPQNAVFYLNGFLLEPKKYRAELMLSLKHKDFGWIHTSKEYRDFKTEAEKRLKQKPIAAASPAP